jgi:hypothetical protein
MNEYRYKIGPQAETDCLLGDGYTVYYPVRRRLRDDISTLPDGPVVLCLTGRLRNRHRVLAEQPAELATIVDWYKNTGGGPLPGAFQILSPSGVIQTD